MLAIINTRQSYLDENGEILAAGRLVVYKYQTTTLADVYQDPLFTQPLGNPVDLSSASWTSTQLYASESTTTLVQRYEGVDEYGQSIYSTVETFDSIAGSTGSGTQGDTLEIVDTVEDLRNYAGMLDTQVVLVKGYSSPTDCYVRKYIWSESSMAIDNGGTILTSTTSPTGRWILLYDGRTLDIRAFGVIPGSTDVNSQFRAACNCAATAKVTIVIPAGTYTFASAGTFDAYCPIDVAPGVKLQRGSGATEDPSSWYVLRLWDPSSTFSGTLAGAGFKVTLEGPGWEETTHPLTLWDNAARGYDEGTATFGLLLTDTSPVSIDTDRSYSRIVLRAKGIPVTIKADSTVYIDHLEGTGSITWLGAVPFLREARRSHCNTQASSVASRTSELFIVDKPLTLASSTSVSCLVQVLPPATLSLGTGCTISRGVLGYPGCIAGANGFASDAEVDINLYTNPNSAMDSWNRSTASNALDLKSRTVTIAPAKSGRIVNGVIQADSTDTSVELILDNVEFVGYYAGTTIRANNCTFSHQTTKPLGAGTHSYLTDCAIKTVNYLIVDPDTVTNWTRVAITGRVVKKGNGGVWRDVRLSSGCYFVPDDDGHLGNFSWVGGAALSIHLDCSQRSTEGACVLFNFEIRGLIGLAHGIKAFDYNTSARYWAGEGHYNVRIGDNEGGPATYGTAVGTQTSGGDSLITIPCDTTQILFLTKDHSYGQVRAAGRVWAITSIDPASGPPSWSGEGGFVSYPPGVPFISGSRTRGDVGDNTRCTFNFELYRKRFV